MGELISIGGFPLEEPGKLLEVVTHGVVTLDDLLRPPDDGSLAKQIQRPPSDSGPEANNIEKLLAEKRRVRDQLLGKTSLLLDKMDELVPA